MYRCNLIFVCFHIDVLYTSEAVACRIELTFLLCVNGVLPVLSWVMRALRGGKRKEKHCVPLENFCVVSTSHTQTHLPLSTYRGREACKGLGD